MIGSAGCNLFLSTNQNEVTIGIDIHDYNNYYDSKTSILGYSIGYKFHFTSKKRLSHFYSETNLNFCRYRSGPGPSFNYKFTPDPSEYGLIFNTHYSAYTSISIGYEVNCSKYISIINSIGPSFIYSYSFTNNGHENEFFRISPYYKLGFRINVK